MRLVAVSVRGRYRDYRIASEPVSRMIEAVGAVAAEVTMPPRRLRPRDEALRTARLCYDHLAGRLGVALANSLQATGHLVLTDEGGEVTPAGDRFLAGFGVDLPGARRARKSSAARASTGSERRSHLAGAVGAALSARLLTLGWVERLPDTRALAITDAGRHGLARTFRLDPSQIVRTGGLAHPLKNQPPPGGEPGGGGMGTERRRVGVAWGGIGVRRVGELAQSVDDDRRVPLAVGLRPAGRRPGRSRCRGGRSHARRGCRAGRRPRCRGSRRRRRRRRRRASGRLRTGPTCGSRRARSDDTGPSGCRSRCGRWRRSTRSGWSGRGCR